MVIGADTVVALDGAALAKPADAVEATGMLRQLRGAVHHVYTGVALRREDGREWAAVVSTRVVMRDYGDQEIHEYVKRGEPFDKAGGYAVQDAAFRPVERLQGCYLNVVGLPLCGVAAGLETVGVSVPAKPWELLPPCDWCRRGEPLVTTG